MKILGISGRKLSGKSTSAKFLVDKFTLYYLDIHVISFADRLKEIFLELFVPEEWNWRGKAIFNHEKIKNTHLPTTSSTVRKGLQWFGTDVCRKAYKDVWIEATRKKIRELVMKCGVANVDSHIRVIIPDVRFRNELRFIQELDGHVVRLLRSSPGAKDKHKSECELDMIERLTLEGHKKIDLSLSFNATIDNRKMDIETKNKALWNLVEGNNWL